MEAIQKAKLLKARRYRNRRLGDFLKELDLSEGRATGIPTIQDELRKNGSRPARIETDDARSYFLIEIPCREGFMEGGDPKRSNDEPIAIQELPAEVERLLEMIKDVPSISRAMLSKQLGISERQVRKILDLLRANGVLTRNGGRSGKWIVNKL